jgi:hypothetical protein
MSSAGTIPFGGASSCFARQSKVPIQTMTVTPDGFRVVPDLLWREPELLDFAAAV